jgi:hypothetical protein
MPIRRQELKRPCENPDKIEENIKVLESRSDKGDRNH